MANFRATIASAAPASKPTALNVGQRTDRMSPDTATLGMSPADQAKARDKIAKNNAESVQATGSGQQANNGALAKKFGIDVYA